MGSTPFTCLLCGISALIFATLVRHRALWFLRPDTMLRGGRQVSTADFVTAISPYFYGFGAFAIVLAIVLLLTLSEDRKRRIAQLPRWKRFLFWPIDRQIAPRKAAGES